MRSRWIEERREKMLAMWEANRNITLDELRVAFAGTSLSVANSTPHRFFARHAITRKKRTTTRLSRIGLTF
jgi:hypothetical protein